MKGFWKNNERRRDLGGRNKTRKKGNLFKRNLWSRQQKTSTSFARETKRRKNKRVFGIKKKFCPLYDENFNDFLSFSPSFIHHQSLWNIETWMPWKNLCWPSKHCQIYAESSGFWTVNLISLNGIIEEIVMIHSKSFLQVFSFMVLVLFFQENKKFRCENMRTTKDRRRAIEIEK